MRIVIQAALAALFAAVMSLPVQAVVINVDLSGASSGTFIDAGGADFAGRFVGQSISGGTGISGSPSNPLTLAADNNLLVANWDPGVSPAGNSILPEPSNQGPISGLLDHNANSLTFTAGSASPPSSFTIAFFDEFGALVTTIVQALSSGYNIYSYAGFDFRGFTIYDVNDPAGLRYMNISYNVVPIPAALPLLATALGGLGFAGWRRKKAAAAVA